MVRRSTPQATKDELAFPVRVKIAVPPLGLGKALDEAHHWLKDEVGSGRFAVHSQPGFACETAAFYFCAVQDAQRFLSAFPALEMADGTISLRRLAS